MSENGLFLGYDLLVSRYLWGIVALQSVSWGEEVVPLSDDAILVSRGGRTGLPITQGHETFFGLRVAVREDETR
jgi:hypothetical protein